ncbi:hypothetical protein [Kutzneria kofuensis]|uniref:Secreted protein n=1 Tax=Kutzneria kofuensis TaxID=103725 RepID=A0A7W9NHW2_9PSEU|nr:hypothetical protein [Kutzneria kofuensis]MBB5893947.1 hypothetical protein [Kutzneria kofuensis]
MLRKLLVVVPALAMVAVTIGSASATTASRPATVPLSADRAACTADMPEVKALSTSMTDFVAAITATPPDPAKVQGIIGDMVNEVVALQKAGCLPQLPGTQTRVQDPQQCLTAVVNALAALLNVLAANIAVPPDPTAVTGAITKLGAAVTAINNNNCLPIKLPVPGAPGGLPAPPGGTPAPPGGLPAPPTIPGT